MRNAHKVQEVEKAKEDLDKMLLLVTFAKLKYLYTIYDDQNDYFAIEQLSVDITWLSLQIQDKRKLRKAIWETINNSPAITPSLRKGLKQLKVV